MDEETVRVHHLGHHAASTHALNKVLSTLREHPETKHLAKMGVDKLLHHLDEVPEEFRTAVANAGGGYVNHELFWNTLAPGGGGGGGGPVDARLLDEVAARFGSAEGLREALGEAAGQLYGSGWVWLVYNSLSAQLEILTTANQEHPAAAHPGSFPLLALDLWEHAYYLKHQNRRADYVEAFWALIDWEEVARRLEDASKHMLDGHQEL